MSEPTLGRGIADVWIVWAQEHDRSGDPEFLAAYDGKHASEQAGALVEIIEKAGCHRKVSATAVPLWPILFGDTEHGQDFGWSNHCSIWKRKQGQAYPRTCERCGLGPCPFFNSDGTKKPV
jgi:hypothetical protein